MKFSSPEDKELYIHSVFSRIAGVYDTMNKLISFNQDRAWRKKAALKTGIRPGDTVLDCCCGTGALTCQLVPLAGEKGKVVGIDFVEEMLERAKKNCPGADFILGNVLDLPFDANSFNAAAMAFALRNVAHSQKALEEMVRVVEPGGKVVILELNRPSIPVFKHLFNLYFNHIVPFLGSRKSGHSDPYIYLPSSYSFLPPPGELLKSMQQAGLTETGVTEMTGGVVALYWGTVAPPTASQPPSYL